MTPELAKTMAKFEIWWASEKILTPSDRENEMLKAFCMVAFGAGGQAAIQSIREEYEII